MNFPFKRFRCTMHQSSWNIAKAFCYRTWWHCWRMTIPLSACCSLKKFPIMMFSVVCWQRSNNVLKPVAILRPTCHKTLSSLAQWVQKQATTTRPRATTSITIRMAWTKAAIIWLNSLGKFNRNSCVMIFGECDEGVKCNRIVLINN